MKLRRRKEIAKAFLFLSVLFLINMFCHPTFVKADSTGQLTAAIFRYNGEKLESTYQLSPLKENSHVLAVEGECSLDNDKIVIEGTLPTPQSEIEEVAGTMEQLGGIADGAKSITYDTKNGKKSYTITYMLDDKASSFYGALYGSIYFELKIKNGLNSDNYILICATSSSKELQSGNHVLPQVEYAYLENSSDGTVLAEDNGIIKAEKKYNYITVPAEIPSVDIQTVRKQEEIGKFLTNTTSLQWMSQGQNYISFNGEKPQTYHVQADRFTGKYKSQEYQLEPGLNVINVIYQKANPDIVINRFSVKDKNLDVPVLYDDSFKYASGTQQRYCRTYVINWEGNSSDTKQKSSDASLAELDCFPWFVLNKDMVSFQSSVDTDGTKHKVIVPTTDTSAKLLLGILTKESGTKINVVGNEAGEGGYFEDGRDHCGFYYGVRLSDLTENSEGNRVVQVVVTAPDGITTQTHEIEIIRRSSECKLLSMDVEQASVDDLASGLSAGTTEYYMDVSDSDITFKNLRVSDGATVAIDGQDITPGSGSLVAEPDDITRIVVTAQDQLTKKTYLFLHRRGDGTLPYYTISQETKDKAQEMLDVGWTKRDEKELRSINGGYWPLFKACATDTLMDRSVVFDVTTKTYKQATDYGAAILQLVLMGENPYEYTDDQGNNLVGYLRDHYTGPYANTIWALMGLKAAGTDIPEDLLKTVKGIAENKSYDPDMRGWALAAVSDMLDKKEVARLVESFRPLQRTSGDEAGMFYNFWYRFSNSESHGCVLVGMAGAGIDVEKQFAVEDGSTPLTALKKYQRADGSFNYYITSTDYDSFWNNVIIGLGDTAQGEGGVWQRCGLSDTKYEEVLAAAESILGQGSQDPKQAALSAAYSEAKSAYQDSAGSVYGIGQQYYALYEAVAAIDPGLVGKPNLRVCSMEESDAVDALIAEIDQIGTDYYGAVKKIQNLKNRFDALGGDDLTLKARLQGYVTNADVLTTACNNIADVLAVVSAIADLPDEVNLGYKNRVDSVWGTYQALSDEKKEGVYNFNKLSELYYGIGKIYDVYWFIEKLPDVDTISLDDKSTMAMVTQAQEAYNELGSNEKQQITNYGKLTAILDRIQDLTAAKPVVEQIAAIGQITRDNYLEKEPKVIMARNSYEKLTDLQKSLVTNYGDLEEAELTLLSVKTDEDIGAIIQNIDQLRRTTDAAGNETDGPLKLTEDKGGVPTWDIWSPWTWYVVNVRGMVERVEEERRTEIANLEDLAAAEKYISQLKASDMVLLMAALPDSSTVVAAGEEGLQLTPEQIAAIGEACAAYNSLTQEEQEALLADPVNVELKENMDALITLAGTYEGFLEAYLRTFVEEVGSFYQDMAKNPVTRENLPMALDILDRYNGLYAEYQDVLAGMSTTVDGKEMLFADMIGLISSEAARTQQDMEDAQVIDDWILALPTDITDENVQAVEEELNAIEAAYTLLSDQARTYVNNLERMETVKTVLMNYKREIAGQKKTFQAGRPDPTAKATAYNTVKLTWNAYDNADSYLVYRRIPGQSWKRLAVVTTLYYTDKTAQPKLTYNYTVKAQSRKWGDVAYSKYRTDVKAVTSLSKTTLKSAVSASYKSAKLTWEKVSGASGYRAYRATSKNGKYQFAGQASKGTLTTLTDSKGLAAGKTYYYKVFAYRLVNGQRVYGSPSDIKAVKIIPGATKITKASPGNKSVTLSWNKVSGASGYRVYRCLSKDGFYSAVKQVGSSTSSYKDTGLKKGTVYYYKVRAYRTVNGVKVFGPATAAKAMKAK